jgi:hypothetical protein
MISVAALIGSNEISQRSSAAVIGFVWPRWSN